jgi:hypothetical protein
LASTPQEKSAAAARLVKEREGSEMASGAGEEGSSEPSWPSWLAALEPGVGRERRRSRGWHVARGQAGAAVGL